MVREREEIIYINMIKVSRWAQNIGWYTCGFLACKDHLWWAMIIAFFWIGGWSVVEDRYTKEEVDEDEGK